MCVCVGGGRLCRWWNTGCALDDASGDACKFVTGVDGSFRSFDLVSILDEMTGFASLDWFCIFSIIWFCIFSIFSMYGLCIR